MRVCVRRVAHVHAHSLTHTHTHSRTHALTHARTPFLLVELPRLPIQMEDCTPLWFDTLEPVNLLLLDQFVLGVRTTQRLTRSLSQLPSQHTQKGTRLQGEETAACISTNCSFVCSHVFAAANCIGLHRSRAAVCCAWPRGKNFILQVRNTNREKGARRNKRARVFRLPPPAHPSPPPHSPSLLPPPPLSLFAGLRRLTLRLQPSVRTSSANPTSTATAAVIVPR